MPLAMGWIQPMILLPVTALSGLPADQLEAILAHELAHIRRYDYLFNLVQSVVETLLFTIRLFGGSPGESAQNARIAATTGQSSSVGDRLVYARAGGARGTARCSLAARAVGGGRLVAGSSQASSRCRPA